VDGARILLVEDDPGISAGLARALTHEGYDVVVTSSGQDAIRTVQEGPDEPDVVLLDLGLPDMDGLDVIRRIRRDAMTPIVILSARFAEREKVEALDRGADDFVTKPFGLEELHARLRVVLRRGAGPGGDADGRVVVGPLAFDARRHEVRVGEEAVDLTPREFELLRVLLGEQGRIVTKGKLLRAVWGQAYQGEDSYVYVHVSQLRHKLAAADRTGALRDLIVTEPGIGYRVRAPEPAAAAIEDKT